MLALTNQTPYNVFMPETKSLVAIIMGSKSDWDTMRKAVETLDELGIPNEARVLSAHRTPDATTEFARGAVDPRRVYDRGRVIDEQAPVLASRNFRHRLDRADVFGAADLDSAALAVDGARDFDAEQGSAP